MTSEQIIILGFLAAAFVAGWLTSAVTGRRDRAAQRPEPQPSEKGPDLGPSAGEQRFEGAVQESRLELDRAIRAYHSAVTLCLRNGGFGDSSAEATLEVLARALVGLALAVDHTSEELAADNPRAEILRASGFELRVLAQDVMMHSSESELPTGVFDRLEQLLASAASTILAPGRLQPGAH